MEAEAQLYQDLEQIGRYVQDITRAEFAQQGHNLTGKSSASIDYRVTQGRGPATWVITLEHERHMTYLNTGVPADRIPYGGRTGRGGKSAFIEALTRWAKLRGMAGGFREAKRIAFAVATTMKREGMPTRGAFAFTNNGRRTGWLDHPVNTNEREVEDRLYNAYADYLANKLEERLEIVVRKYSNMTLTKN